MAEIEKQNSTMQRRILLHTVAAAAAVTGLLACTSPPVSAPPQKAPAMSTQKSQVEAGITMKYERVHRVLGEGNFVLVVSEGQFAGRHSAFYDLFRVQDGKIAEHWDTIEAIPLRAQWKNDNGKF